MSEPTSAADWPHHDMLAKGWVVLYNGYAVSTGFLGQRHYIGPAAANQVRQVRHPTTRVFQERGRYPFDPPLPWWVVTVMARDMVSRPISGVFATQADAQQIAELIRRSSDAWDAAA